MMTHHQQKQKEVIDHIAQQVSSNSLQFSTVAPTQDYAKDPRICLTSVHLPHQPLLDRVQQELIEPLRKIDPSILYYPSENLHMTIKNIRVISDPPNFTAQDIEKATNVFTQVVPKHQKFSVYFYRLLLFPNNLALIGTTDEELDALILDLDKNLKAQGIPDDKVYANSRYFFSNMTLARFNEKPSVAFQQKIQELSASLRFEPYEVDSVTLVSCNAAFYGKNIHGTWKLP